MYMYINRMHVHAESKTILLCHMTMQAGTQAIKVMIRSKNKKVNDFMAISALYRTANAISIMIDYNQATPIAAIVILCL